tara:strand:- start:298 stop:495 length:198 start_codon:yes stop_codon:yes gene_type:complete
MQQVDYIVQRHQNVFLLVPQNYEAVCNLENYRESNFNKNGALIMVRESLKDWLDAIENDWVVSHG